MLRFTQNQHNDRSFWLQFKLYVTNSKGLAFLTKMSVFTNYAGSSESRDDFLVVFKQTPNTWKWYLFKNVIILTLIVILNTKIQTCLVNFAFSSLLQSYYYATIWFKIIVCFAPTLEWMRFFWRWKVRGCNFVKVWLNFCYCTKIFLIFRIWGPAMLFYYVYFISRLTQIDCVFFAFCLYYIICLVIFYTIIVTCFINIEMCQLFLI